MHHSSSGRVRATFAGTGRTATSLSLALGLGLGAGQLVATPAASAAPVLQAATSSTVKTTLLDSVNTTTLGWGSKVRVTAKLRDAKTGKAVGAGYIRLQAWRNGAWHTWQVKKVPASGTVRFYTMPLISGYLRTFTYGTSKYTRAYGKTLHVKVVPSGREVLAEARRHTGALYKYGASGPKRFDCSGFTKYVYKKAAGRKLPHKANSQQRYGKAVSKSKKRIGDLIVFRSGSHGYHAAVYAGGGYMYDSPHSGARVGKHKIFSKSYVVRRLTPA
ncbi:C40 family peptidase [Mangrovihabitans endophyticus]|uniref:NlpC/P60 domain-containing protein n=1 Tax=Mangrovihabitans endophyticus TaxID=1751298 RepID=A0A8J3BVA1_9ACTN|nr:NlpC/P60 family protein [Mangrovihabitans endophyticus]GGK70489.1 hypothetical protein GCM10012284_00450 [Mangrovihabitans endophyticus]